ncbi:histone-lysine N-methyltransferase SUV39H2-like [Mytilus edulis]|uniref:histone-lysine N-methyltransferase SUV39H2-like n=1 Tax=Mytilus edulis TaxID=6550 RepID=UPI0039F13517
MEDEIKDAQVSCLSGIIDLQRACQKQNLKLSAETNQYLVYLTLKKLGPFVAQKLISKLVEKGEINWEDGHWEVEQIIDHCEDEGEEYYLIKWKDWSNAHNSWEPKANLECTDLLEEFHVRGTKRKFEYDDSVPISKRSRVDEIFQKLKPMKGKISPLQLLSVSSPVKGGKPIFKGLIATGGKYKPKYKPSAGKPLNPRSKAYKQKKVEIIKALKEWQVHLNAISTDPAGIVVENNIDLEGPPENFVYINDYKPMEGIIIPNDPLVGCECDSCLDNKKKCCVTQCGSEFAYYKNKRLRVLKGTPIYECNKRCKCGPECPNRVVQLGRKCKLSIFRTINGRGWGVKTLQKIKKGSFVVEYVGEVITDVEAEKRGKYYDAVGRTYLFDLDYNDGDCPYTVDAGYYGNVSHFINHSCDPNLEVFGVWINTLDPTLPRIALFSRRDIEKGEELTFDYMMTGDTTNQPPTLDQVEKDLAAEFLKTPVLQTYPDMPEGEGDSLKVTLEENDTLPELKPDEVKETGDAADSNDSNDSNIPELSIESDEVFDEPPKLETQKSELIPKSLTDQYRIVCQCGAKNCRKYLF